MKILFIFLISLTITGCTTTLINQKYPKIPLPERPSISSKLTKEDFKKMARYSEKLEIGINGYNIYADKQNKKIEEHFQKK